MKKTNGKTGIKTNGKKIVYDWRKSFHVVEGECGRESTRAESIRGQFPSCFKEDWSKGPSNASSQVNFLERGCSCGNHILYWARIPEEGWPDDYEERVRVIEIG